MFAAQVPAHPACRPGVRRLRQRVGGGDDLRHCRPPHPRARQAQGGEEPRLPRHITSLSPETAKNRNNKTLKLRIIDFSVFSQNGKSIWKESFRELLDLETENQETIIGFSFSCFVQWH